MAFLGKNILARAKDGSGKIGMYCIPTIEKANTGLAAIQGLIIVPIHELAEEVFQTCTGLIKHVKIKVFYFDEFNHLTCF